MRKLAFLLIAGFVGFSAYAEGQVCHQTPSGKVICNYIDRGGGYEEDICWRQKTDNDSARADEEDGGTGWWRKKLGTDCTAQKNGASWAQCVENYHSSTEHIRSCAAFDCKSDYLLYTTNKRREIPVVGENRKVGSQGLCREKSYLNSLCDIGCGCADDEKCVLNEVSVTNHGRTVQAFIGEELCVCEKDQDYVQPGPCDDLKGAEKECCLLEKVSQKPVQWNKEKGSCECIDTKKVLENGECVDKGGTTQQKNCEYFFKGFVQCGSVKIYVNKRYPISEDMVEELGLGNCDDIQNLIDNDKARLRELEKKFCKDPNRNNYGDLVDDDREYQDARDRLDAFMRNAELNVNVWKDAEGKFNTARLASDLTAGVVLGTVGGIVSANIIKKKQLEKGYDALHCTVGGQKVADWGDEFSVGLRRY